MPALRNTQIPHLLLAVLYYYCWKALEKEGKQKGHGFLSLDKLRIQVWKFSLNGKYDAPTPQILFWRFLFKRIRRVETTWFNSNKIALVREMLQH